MRLLSAFGLIACVLTAGGHDALAQAIGEVWVITLADMERDRADPFPLVDEDGVSIPQSNYSLHLDADRLGLAAGASGEWEPTPGLLVFGAIDSGLVERIDARWTSNGRPIADEFEETWLIRGLGVDITSPDGGPWSIILGKQRFTVGRGVLIDDLAVGGDVVVDLEPLSLRAGAWWLGRAAMPEGWPFARLEVAWRPGPFTEIKLFGLSTRFDGDQGRAMVGSAVAQAFARWVRRLVDRFADRLPTREARADGLSVGRFEQSALAAVLSQIAECTAFDAVISPWWAGVEVEALLEGHTIGGVALLGGGGARIAPAISDACPTWRRFVERAVEPLTFDVRSYGLEGRWRAHIDDWLYLGAFGLWLSGHGDDTSIDRLDTYTALLAPAPYLSRPLLFFGSGLGTGLLGRPAAPAGLASRGVIAPGLSALIVPHDTLELDLAWAPLWTEDGVLFDGGRFYGHELDLKLRWSADSRLTLRGEAAVLDPGSFFPEGGGPWWRVGLSIEGRIQE